jgi:hypothetical protein
MQPPLALTAPQGRLMAPQVVLMVKAISDARSVLADHLAAEHPDAKATINSLLGILDDRKLLAAVGT